MEKEQNIIESEETKINVGITHGDFNGISYEIIMKALSNPRILEMITPIIYGSSKVASYHRKNLNFQDLNFNLIKKSELAGQKKINIVNCFENEVKIEVGQSTEIAGNSAYLALEKAVEDLQHKRFDVLVTAPINKKNLQSEKFHFPGHTEYLATKFNVTDYLMLMVSEKLRIGVITGHIPISEVPKKINKDLILRKIKILNHSLKRDFAIQKPKIAILGLNPHAGDEGLLGKEEIEIIKPAINAAQQEKILAYGPFPADAFFGTSTFAKYDGVLAMYHDQGLIPFKAIAFENGVNYTAGLPIVRTSPDHGTAYDIAGKNIASCTSLREAIYLACDIFKNRAIYDEIHANPLPYSTVPSTTMPNDFEEGLLPLTDEE